eukprot:9875755-Alexandrium_andersonii.AAC.1
MEGKESLSPATDLRGITNDDPEPAPLPHRGAEFHRPRLQHRAPGCAALRTALRFGLCVRARGAKCEGDG